LLKPSWGNLVFSYSEQRSIVCLPRVGRKRFPTKLPGRVAKRTWSIAKLVSTDSIRLQAGARRAFRSSAIQHPSDELALIRVGKQATETFKTLSNNRVSTGFRRFELTMLR